MSIFSTLTITFVIASSIVSFDLHSRQGNKSTLPSWVMYVYPIYIGLAIAILVMNWKYAILIFIICYILGTVLPVLDIIGNILMNPFKPKVQSINNSMKNKTLAIFGIGTYILSVLSSASDSEGNSIVPIALIAVSGIATAVFIIMATIRLWKISKFSSILLTSSIIILFILSVVQGVVSPPYGSPLIILFNITKVINFIAFFWAVSLLLAMAKHENKVIDTLKNSYGLTPEESSTILEEKRKGNEKSVEKILATAQERAKTKYKEATGVDAKDIVPEIGKEISWADIVNHAFRVLEFDRNDTTIDQNNQVKAKSSFQPYGYLLAESPILNNKVRIPIIHRDDFLLAAGVFDEPKMAAMVIDKELLVTYAPKNLLQKGLSGSPHHVLHYAITPRGTLDSYYSKNNDMYMAKPDPQKLFGPFVYQGEIKVQINPELKF